VDQNEKLAVQTVLMEELNRRMAEEPTLLIDTLMAGQGGTFVLQTLTQQAGAARRRADTLSHLINGLMGEFKEPEQREVA
jgi:hypothetical protein